MLLHGCLYNGLRRNILAQIQHIIAVVFQKHLHNILSDVVNITLNSSQNDLTFLLLLLTTGIQLFLDNPKSALCRLRAHQKLRQEHGPLLKALSHYIQCRNDLAVDDLQGILDFQQFLCRLHRLVF